MRIFTFNKGKLPESLNDTVFAYDPEAVVAAYLQPKPRSRFW